MNPKNHYDAAPPRQNQTTEEPPTISVNETGAAEEETMQGTPDFNISDKRRFSSEAEAPVDEEGQQGQASEPELEELRARLSESEAKRAEAERQVDEFSDRFRKAQVQLRSENDELRARLQRTFDQRLEAARGDLVASLLDTLDNLQRAVAAADLSPETGPAFEALHGGVQATAEMFETQLRRLGLTRVVSEGEPFNPELHEAVEIAVVPKEQDGLVVGELRPGYKYGERLLRPAQVRVGRASE